STTDVKTKKVLGKYVTTLEAMARTKKARESEKDELKRLVYALRHQREFAFFITDDLNSPAAKLLQIGKKAIPYLIAELDNAELTRSVCREISTNRRVISPLYVLRVGDCAYGILSEMAGREFGDAWYIHGGKAKMSPKQVQEEARKWWAK